MKIKESKFSESTILQHYLSAQELGGRMVDECEADTVVVSSCVDDMSTERSMSGGIVVSNLSFFSVVNNICNKKPWNFKEHQNSKSWFTKNQSAVIKNVHVCFVSFRNHVQ